MKPEIMKISRHRLSIDGNGVTTLVAFHGCPLNCKYCINDECHSDSVFKAYISEERLVDILSVDDIYFRMTGGGVTFGGGEPLVHASYIRKFAKIMPREWKLRVETSLYTDWNNIKMLLPYVDQWIVDVKDINPDIFEKYTGCSQGKQLLKYLQLSDCVGKENILFRIPRIPGFNTDEDIQISQQILKEYGDVEVFDYFVKDISEKSKAGSKKWKENELQEFISNIPNGKGHFVGCCSKKDDDDDHFSHVSYRFEYKDKDDNSLKLEGIAEFVENRLSLQNCECMLDCSGEHLELCLESNGKSGRLLLESIQQVMLSTKSYKNFEFDYKRIIHRNPLLYLLELTQNDDITWSVEKFDETDGAVESSVIVYKAEFGEEEYQIVINNQEWSDEDDMDWVPGDFDDVLSITVGDHLNFNYSEEKSASIRKLVQKIDSLIITVEDVVVRSSNLQCLSNGHLIENVKAKICVLTANGIQEKTADVSYCEECNAYYMSENEYRRIKAYGKLCCRVVTDITMFSNSNSLDLRDESILRSYGYTVNAKDNLSHFERQRILSFIVQNNIMDKLRVIDFLEWCIDQHSRHKNAVEKYREDIAFLKSDEMFSKNIVVGTIYRKEYKR